MQTIDEQYYFTFEGSNLSDSLFDSEWILTDGLGGWASQSISGALTRRYHSLFLLNSQNGKVNLLPQIEDFVGQGDIVPLSTNIYSDVIHPEGFKRLEKVLVGPTVKYFYRLGEESLVKEIFKPKGETQTYVRYQWFGKQNLNLTLLPLFSFTDFHSLRHRSYSELVQVSKCENGVSLDSLDSGFKLCLQTEDFAIHENSDWYYNFKLIREQDRGLDFNCDLLTKIKFTKLLKPNSETFFLISNREVRGLLSEDFGGKYDSLTVSLKHFKPKNKLASSKISATLELSLKDYFIQTNRDSKGVVAGYHWFEEWGRDTFITLNFLTEDDFKSNIRLQEFAISVFQEFFSASRNGILPNRFFGQKDSNAGGRAEYNSVDALLWAIVALKKFQNSLPDQDMLKSIWEKSVFVLRFLF